MKILLKTKKSISEKLLYLLIILLIVIAIASLVKVDNLGIFAIWNISTQESFGLGTYGNTSANSSNVIFLNQTEYHNNYKNENMVLWLHYNNGSSYGENGSTFHDFSQYQNNLSCSGITCPAFTSSGKFAGAYQFNGVNTNKYGANVSSVPDFGSINYSISAWFKTSSSADQEIFSQDSPGTGDHELQMEIGGRCGTGSKLCFCTYETTYGNVMGTTNVADGEWHFGVITKSGTIGSIYVDGALQNSSTVKNVINTGNIFTWIGRHQYGSAIGRWTFNGTIDEVAIWNRSLSADEIQDLYRLKKGTYQSAVNNTNGASMFTHFNFSTRENSSVNNITFQVRSCDDIVCSGETYVGYDNTSSTYFNLTQDSWNISFLNYNQYFQWKAWLNRGLNNPQIVNVSVGYENAPPVITLISPSSGAAETSSNTISFSYSTTDLGDIANCSLIVNNVVKTTDTSIAKGVTQTLSAILSNAVYTWSVNCTDVTGSTGNSTSHSLTVNVDESPTSSSTVSSSDSGTRDISISEKTPSNIQSNSISKSYFKIPENTPIVIPASAEFTRETSLKEISIITNLEINEVDIKIKSVKRENLESIPDYAYKYFSIESSNIKDEDIKESYIFIEVEKSLFTENNYKTKDAKIVRYVNEEWTALETYLYEERSETYVFSAKTSGFEDYSVYTLTVSETKKAEAQTTEKELEIQPGISLKDKISITVDDSKKLMIIGISSLIVVMLTAYFLIHLTLNSHKRFKRNKKLRENIH